MIKKAISMSAPFEVLKLLDDAGDQKPRTKISIKLLRHFFQENPSFTDMTGILSQEMVDFTYRIPCDLLQDLDEFAARYAYSRKVAFLVAIMSSARDMGLTQRTAAHLGN